MLILIAGPYTSGASSEAGRAENLRNLNRAAYEVFKKGHTPVVCANLALPVIDAAGGDAFDTVLAPLSLALAERCDAALRLGGPSTEADQEVARVRANGGVVFRRLQDIPGESTS